MTEERPPTAEGGWRGGGGRASVFGRRSFLRGAVAGVVGAAGGTQPGSGAVLADLPTGGKADSDVIPFQGDHQAGILTPQQPVGAFASFDVTVADRRALADLFRTLTARARFLTAGGSPPRASPSEAQPDTGILGPEVVADNLTVTVALGATLFEDRFGLAALKPAQLITMAPFRHDDLDPVLSQGDLLVQLCAGHRDATVHAFLDILAHTSGAMRPRWRIDGVRNPPRPVGIPRDWFGFKDGISNPDTTDTAQMDQLVWVRPHTAEPAWAAGGTYQVVRIVHFKVEAWQGVPLAQQERIFGRRKSSGAPMYAVSDNASDLLDPIYTNDPQGLITPLDSHIRLANPQTPQTVDQHHPASQLRVRLQPRHTRRPRSGPRVLLLPART